MYDTKIFIYLHFFYNFTSFNFITLHYLAYRIDNISLANQHNKRKNIESFTRINLHQIIHNPVISILESILTLISTLNAQQIV